MNQAQRHIIKTLKTLAKKSNSRREYITLVKKKYGKKVKCLGSGISRTVYTLPCHMVLKLSPVFEYPKGVYPYRYSQNYAEYRVLKIKKFKNMAPKLYSFIHGRGFCANVMQRAKHVGSVKSKDKKKFERLESQLVDLHNDNIGYIKNKLVIIDLGCESCV